MYDEKIVTKVCDTLVKAGSTFLGDKKEAYKKGIAKEANEQAKMDNGKNIGKCLCCRKKSKSVM